MVGTDGSVVVVVLTGTTTVSEAVVVGATVSVEVSVVDGTAEEDAPPVGISKVTPADWQSAWAATTVFSNSAAVQPFWTHGTREETKVVALQIQAMSVCGQPEVPKEVIAQERAQLGRFSSWAETV